MQTWNRMETVAAWDDLGEIMKIRQRNLPSSAKSEQYFCSFCNDWSAGSNNQFQQSYDADLTS